MPPAPENSPPSAAPPETAITIRKADTTEQIVALTFDAGADTGFASQILDTLAREGIRASFGITGKWAEMNPDLVKRMVNDGHQIINHTYDHRSFTGFSTGDVPLTTDQRLEELHRTQDIISSIAGYDTRPYFRPPYGDYDDSLLADIAHGGYTVNAMWSVDSLGWKGLRAQEIADRCVSGTEPGGILLMHVGAQSQDAAALPDVIQRLRSQGYRFVTVAEMVSW